PAARAGEAPKPAPKAVPSKTPAPAATAPTKPSRRPEPTQPPPPPPASARQRTAARQDPPPLATTWPSSQAGQQPPSSAQPPATPPVEQAPAQRPDERVQEPARAPEPPQKRFEELTVSSDSVLGLSIENRLASETARVEDKVDAKVTRDVKVGDRVAVPAGSRVLGSVMLVERGGKFKERARLGIRFHTLVLADGTRVPISTE